MIGVFFDEIGFISHHNNLCLLVRISFDFLKPAVDAFKSRGHIKVVHENDADGVFIISAGYSAEGLLTGLDKL